MWRLGGRTARNAEPVDPAIRTTHKCQCIIECGLLTGTWSAEGIMASGPVCRANRPNTWLHRPAMRREDFPCQLGAVHTWHFSDVGRCPMGVRKVGKSGHWSGRAFALAARPRSRARREHDRQPVIAPDLRARRRNRNFRAQPPGWWDRLGTLALRKRLVLNASCRCLLGTLRGKKTWDINKRLDPFWIEPLERPRRAHRRSPNGTLWNIPVELFRLRSGEFDSLSPLLGIGGNKGRKFGWWTCERLAT